MDPSLPRSQAESALDEIGRLSHRLQFESMSGAEIDAVHAELRRAIVRLRATEAERRVHGQGPAPPARQAPPSTPPDGTQATVS